MGLTEKEMGRLIKRVLNESKIPSFVDDVNSLRRIMLKLQNSVEEYENNKNKGDYKRLADNLDMVRKDFKNLKNAIQDLEQKL